MASARTEQRRAERAAGVQSTQRSWSNYVGDKPIERYKYTDFYGDSPMWGFGASSPIEPPPEEEPPKPTKKEPPKGKNRYGYEEKDYTKEGWVKDRYGYWVRPKGYKPSAPNQAPAMPAMDDSWRFSLIGGMPTPLFPPSLSLY